MRTWPQRRRKRLAEMLYAEPWLKKAIGLYAERLHQLGLTDKVNRSDTLRRALIAFFLSDPVAKDCLSEAGVKLPVRGVFGVKGKKRLINKLAAMKRAGQAIPEIKYCRHNRLRFECAPCSARDKAKAERDSRNTTQA